MLDRSLINSDDKTASPKTGYDLPVYGLENGSFYPLHILALFLTFLSLSSVAITITLSIRRGWNKNFFRKWTKSERFVVYLALCDGIFNIFHTADHAQLLITKQHVQPRELCTFYAFVLVQFVHGQILMVNMIAINVFRHLFFGQPLNFGKWDWKLLTWSFGLPSVVSTICTATGQFGTTGVFCFVDPIAGRIVYSSFAILFVPVFLVNSVLYLLTWRKIRAQVNEIIGTLRGMSQSAGATRNTAKTLSLFIVAFTVQWTGPIVFSVWSLLEEPPLSLHYWLVGTANIGGVLNLIVYMMVWRNKTRHKESGGSNAHLFKVKNTNNATIPDRLESLDVPISSRGGSKEAIGSLASLNNETAYI